MTKKSTIILYVIFGIVIIGGIFAVWAIDSGKIASHADEPPAVTTAQELKTLPNPDNSTFSKIFGTIAGWFSR